MPESYKCALCGGTFDTTRPDEEAMAECKSIFGQSITKEESDVVCDDCWKKVNPANHPHAVEQAMANIIRQRKRQ